MNLADVHVELDEPALAEPLAEEALELSLASGDDLAILANLGILACALSLLGRARRAGLLWGASERLARESGHDSPWVGEREKLRERIGERSPEFERAFEEGPRLSPDEAVRLV